MKRGKKSTEVHDIFQNKDKEILKVSEEVNQTNKTQLGLYKAKSD